MIPRVIGAALVLACTAGSGAIRGTQPRAAFALRADRILDPRTGAYSSPSVVLVAGSKIVDVLPATQYRAVLADSTIDLRGLTLLPGLIDAHVHLGIGGQPAANALADLRAGFTTLLDLGARTHRLLRVRDSINSAAGPAPRVLAAGMWNGIQGGVCEFNGIGIAGGAEAFRARVRENALAGADVIKLCVSGWPNEALSDPQRYELSDDVIAAVVDEARRLNRQVIAHDISLGGVQAALRAGVHGLAHAAYVDSATALKMRTQNVFMISTLASIVGADTSAGSRALVSSLSLAHRLGVLIVFGTDGGVLPHGRNAEEFAALEQAGLAPLEAIRAATLNAARALGLVDSVGVLARGMSADIVAVAGDPLSDLAVLKSPRFVMARGRLAP